MNLVEKLIRNIIIDIWYKIISNLKTRDWINLSLTCKHLRKLLYTDRKYEFSKILKTQFNGTLKATIYCKDTTNTLSFHSGCVYSISKKKLYTFVDLSKWMLFFIKICPILFIRVDEHGNFNWIFDEDTNSLLNDYVISNGTIASTTLICGDDCLYKTKKDDSEYWHIDVFCEYIFSESPSNILLKYSFLKKIDGIEYVIKTLELKGKSTSFIINNNFRN